MLRLNIQNMMIMTNNCGKGLHLVKKITKSLNLFTSLWEAEDFFSLMFPFVPTKAVFQLFSYKILLVSI